VAITQDGINDLDRSFGRESRSLKAAYELYKVRALDGTFSF